MGKVPAVATLVLVHGAWHGAWVWDQVVAGLDARGVRAVPVELPCTTLDDDTAAVVAAMRAIRGTIVLCGHSYGGAVITAAGAGFPQVEHLVYLAAFMPDKDESVRSIARTGPRVPLDAAIVRGDEGTVTVDPRAARDVFYADCPPEVADAATARLRPQGSATFEQRPIGVAWLQCQSTYVVCAQDRALAPELQNRMAAQRSRQAFSLDTSHSPFLSQPAVVADLLAAIALAE